MSAGSTLVQHDIDKCAPLFAKAVRQAVYKANFYGYDAFVYEALRSNELQKLYWAKGRKQLLGGRAWVIVNPSAVVTHVQDARYGWHYFGLAVDVISRSREWDVTDEWREMVNSFFREVGLHCGADWPHPDKPHYQWTKQFSPSDNDRAAFDKGGYEAVWRLNHAI